MKALVFDSFGSSHVLEYREIPNTPIPMGPNDVLVRTRAIGLNFADIYRRQGRYHIAGGPPYIAGYEGAGEVVEIGSNVTHSNSDLENIKIGDLIGFADVPYANAEYVVVPYEKAIPLPSEISCELAASVLLQGLTAHYLTRDSYPVKAGTVALVHAAAGGVGQLLTQMIVMLGGQVIGLTSSQEKAQIALQCGASHVFLYSDPEWQQHVLQVTKNGEGVDVVYDSVGSTLMDSFKVTRTCGHVVFYGMAGGDPVHVDPRMLMDTSKTLTGGDLWNYLTSRAERVRRAHELFSWISQHKIQVAEPTKFKLEEGRLAHEYLESRKSTGKIILLP
ncbi:hypothetical protein C9374_005292 [Naegleria lovaniensis]|uniref:Enoyl reductase (ER) domain-containing protein n=1 Tax=Naegleria lovaniensis TaxID=51637 RepID=A0AA88KIY5_NAELO|nr:uncharacterized protein C9374_005292 [Naegleria lovaniensis]KAG2382712.1 hypothetical protein C9374_005292 [Naegleria lovaniensis]